MVETNSSEWVIKLQEDVNRIDDISKEVEFWKKRSIYRIPACVTNINPEAYKPQYASFGPYHYGEEHLESMEDDKERALLRFLRRSKIPLESYIKSLSNLVKDFKESYDSLDYFRKEMRDEGLLRLMIRDGCFMLEVMRVATQTLDDNAPNDYASNDPIFSNHGKLNILPYIKRDMLMLENQLPLFVLTNLVAIQNDKSKDEEKKVIQLVLQFYYLNTPVENIMKMHGKCLHILDIFRKSLIYWQEDSELKKRGQKCDIRGCGEEIVRSATELNETGIHFKPSKTGNLQDISFEGGTLKLPPIIVDDTTESMFLNIIAFERFHVGAGNEVTSYIFFMDSIIDNENDVSFLHTKGILQNAIGTDIAVAKLFNSLSKDLVLEPDSSLDQVNKKMNLYCKKGWSKCRAWRANLMNNYFSNPWAITSVIAAIVLFVLTFTQTIYTVYPYYHPGRS